MLDMGDLRVDQQADRCGEGWALARLGQALDAEWPPGADLAAEDAGYVTAQEIPVNGGGISVFPRPRP